VRREAKRHAAFGLQERRLEAGRNAHRRRSSMFTSMHLFPRSQIRVYVSAILAFYPTCPLLPRHDTSKVKTADGAVWRAAHVSRRLPRRQIPSQIIFPSVPPAQRSPIASLDAQLATFQTASLHPAPYPRFFTCFLLVCPASASLGLATALTVPHGQPEFGRNNAGWGAAGSPKSASPMLDPQTSILDPHVLRRALHFSRSLARSI
jgi:hypothetical protein